MKDVIKQSVLEEFRDYLSYKKTDRMFCYINMKQDYTIEMIKIVSGWLDAKFESIEFPEFKWFQLLEVVAKELEKISYETAMKDKLYPQTLPIIEEEILRQCTIKFNKTINQELDDLVDQSLDDLQNPANENPLNIK